jgi:hypothetical protein
MNNERIEVFSSPQPPESQSLEKIREEVIEHALFKRRDKWYKERGPKKERENIHEPSDVITNRYSRRARALSRILGEYEDYEAFRASLAEKKIQDSTRRRWERDYRYASDAWNVWQTSGSGSVEDGNPTPGVEVLNPGSEPENPGLIQSESNTVPEPTPETAESVQPEKKRLSFFDRIRGIGEKIKEKWAKISTPDRVNFAVTCALLAALAATANPELNHPQEKVKLVDLFNSGSGIGQAARELTPTPTPIPEATKEATPLPVVPEVTAVPEATEEVVQEQPTPEKTETETKELPIEEELIPGTDKPEISGRVIFEAKKEKAKKELQKIFEEGVVIEDGKTPWDASEEARTIMLEALGLKATPGLKNLIDDTIKDHSGWAGRGEEAMPGDKIQVDQETIAKSAMATAKQLEKIVAAGGEVQATGEEIATLEVFGESLHVFPKTLSPEPVAAAEVTVTPESVATPEIETPESEEIKNQLKKIAKDGLKIERGSNVWNTLAEPAELFMKVPGVEDNDSVYAEVLHALVLSTGRAEDDLVYEGEIVTLNFQEASVIISRDGEAYKKIKEQGGQVNFNGEEDYISYMAISSFLSSLTE